MLNDAYEALGEHYMTAIMPAQVRKPKQKASAEGTVRDAATWVIAQLRNRALASLAKSTVLCAQYAPAEWHGRLGGGVQADAMVDRLVHGSVRIDLGDVNVRKLLASRK